MVVDTGNSSRLREEQQDVEQKVIETAYYHQREKGRRGDNSPIMQLAGFTSLWIMPKEWI